MSTSSSLSSAKRRRAGGNEMLQPTVNMIDTTMQSDDGKRLMSVQDVLYMLNSKIELLSSKIPGNGIIASDGINNNNNEIVTQLTDTIQDIQSKIEQFTDVLIEYNERIQKMEEDSNNNSILEKIQLLENRINEKILSKPATSDKFDLLSSRKKNNSTKNKMETMVPNKKGATVDDKFVEQTKDKSLHKSNLKKFEEEATKANNGIENVSISFTGLKEQIETNNTN